MNYAQYLLLGGDLAQPEVENRLGRKEVAELAQRIIQGDLEAAAILVENAIKDPENGYISELLASAREAAEQGGDENAQKLWEMVAPVLQQATQSQSLKCGGKVRAKIKKAQIGKKIEAPIKKASVGCNCKKLMKSGGKLIEVDCNEIPIAKNGTVLKFLQPSGTLDMKRSYYKPQELEAFGAVLDDVKGSAINNWLYYNLADNTYYKSSTPVLTNENSGRWVKANDDEINRYHQLKGHIQLKSGNWMMPGDNGLYTSTVNPDYRYAKVENNFLPDLGAKDATWNKDKNLWERQGFTYTKNKDNQYTWVPVEADKKEETPLIDKYGRRLQSDGTYAGPTYGQRNAAAVGMLGADGKTGMTVDERKAWMLGAGKDYLASLNGGTGIGFDVSKYNGESVAQNRALFDAYKGYAAWKQEQDELNRIKNSRINQRTGQINEGWRGMSDQDLMNYNGKMFDLSNEELQRRAQLLSGSRLAIANNTSRNGDEFYVNGRWVDFDDMTGVTGKSLPGQTPIARFQPFLFNSTFQYRKKGGKIISYADYLK